MKNELAFKSLDSQTCSNYDKRAWIFSKEASSTSFATDPQSVIFISFPLFKFSNVTV